MLPYFIFFNVTCISYYYQVHPSILYLFTCYFNVFSCIEALLFFLCWFPTKSLRTKLVCGFIAWVVSPPFDTFANIYILVFSNQVGNCRDTNFSCIVAVCIIYKYSILEIYSHQIPFLKLRKSPGFALIMLKSESHMDLSPMDVIGPSWPIFALVVVLSWAVGILGWLLVRIKDEYSVYYSLANTPHKH